MTGTDVSNSIIKVKNSGDIASLSYDNNTNTLKLMGGYKSDILSSIDVNDKNP